jgi:hypothetical protein
MRARSAQGRPLAATLAVALSFGLSGCGLLSGWPGATGSGGGGKAPVKKVKVSANYSATETVQQTGTFTPAGGTKTNVSGQIARGTFSAKLPVKVNPVPKAAGAAGGGVKAVSGSFISKLDGTADFLAGTGDYHGLRVIDFSKGSFGVACLSWTSKLSNGSNTENGSFSLIGGTKLAGKSRFSGTYTGTRSQTGGPGEPATVTGTIQLGGKVGKPAKKMSADCKALAAQLP